jgi:integrase
VVIYYGRNGIMRFPTGISISAKKVKGKSQFIEFDYKSQQIKSSVPDADRKNRQIKLWKERADIIIDKYLQNGITISASDLKKELQHWKDDKHYKLNTKVLEMLKLFIDMKRKDIFDNPDKSDVSFKDYQTLFNTIIDFRNEMQCDLKISEINNEEWLKNFNIWLSKPREKKIMFANGEIYIPKSKGQLNPKTRKKRFETLRAFFGFLSMKNLIPDTKIIDNFKKQITVPIKIKPTLTIAEIHDLYNFKFENANYRKVIDLFVFACLTGLRWNDIKNFNGEYIDKKNDIWIYKNFTKKTDAPVQIPLCDIAKEILVRYNESLNIISNQHANRLLHEALKSTELFSNPTNNKNRNGMYKRRYEDLTMHKGRDTFISNLIDSTPLNQLMKMTGHTQLSTLQKYVDRTRDVNPNFINIFNKKS